MTKNAMVVGLFVPGYRVSIEANDLWRLLEAAALSEGGFQGEERLAIRAAMDSGAKLIRGTIPINPVLGVEI